MSKKELQTDSLIADDFADDITQRFGYVLSERNEKRGRIYDPITNEPVAEKDYKPRRNLLFRSSVIWPVGKDGKPMIDPFSEKPRRPGKYPIRYYDGCTTLFVDDQPRDKETIDALVKNTQERYFLDGYLFVWGFETMLKTYLDWASYNGNSPYRNPQAEIVYIALDPAKASQEESKRLDMIEEALELARAATRDKMIIHSKFLGIMDTDERTGNKKLDAQIRTEYRKMAMNSPDHFIQTYNDKTIQIRYWIEKGLDSGDISTNIIPNQAVWSKRGTPICDISGLKSREGILNKLIEFSQSKEGVEFMDMLKAVHE